jgi:hypothetical protein
MMQTAFYKIVDPAESIPFFAQNVCNGPIDVPDLCVT